MKKPRFLYHGSSERVDVLMPQQAQDWRHKEGSENGIYATSSRNVALAFALGAVPGETGSVSRVMGGHNPVKMVFVEGHPKFGDKGYLYTVSSEGFEYLGGTAWMNREPVTPMEVLEIKVDDYLHLFRYATAEEKRKIQREIKEKTENTKKKRIK